MKRSKFSLSNHNLFSCQMGNLVPIGLTEVLPGDSIQQATSMLIRVSPLLAPVMHPVVARIHHWFVPHRLVWNDWENFITGGPDGDDASVAPYVAFAPINAGELADYYGLPLGAFINDPGASALPFRGYAMIWNEYYRDQDLQAPLTVDLTDGQDTTTNTLLQSCSWEKDYFTSSRPWEQKGPDITIPLGVNAPVIGTGEPLGLRGTASGIERNMQITATSNVLTGDGGASGGETIGVSETAALSGLIADLTSASSVGINDLREAFALQRMQEHRARFGSRYSEYLRFLGVRSSDARLQRPEYLGGGKQTIQFSEVLQTGVTTDGDDSEGVGNMKGHGIGAMRSNRYRRFFEEHGYIHSVLSVRPKTIYAQGIPRHWSRRSKEDYFQKELQHIGQQAILNKELYALSADPNGTFGYQDRYDEYRRTESRVSGDFRTTLDFWHYARIFGTEPVLNDDFVSCVPTDRVYAVGSEDVLWVMAHHSIQARRLLTRKASSFIF